MSRTPDTEDLNPDPSDQDPPGQPPPDFQAWIADPINARFAKELRSEAARYRVKNRELTQQLSALDPEGAKAILQENRSLKMDLGLERASRRHGVERPSVLKAFLTDAGSLSSLDPSKPTFEDDLDVLVGETIVNAPELRGHPPAAQRGGAQILPQPRGMGQLTRADLQHMTGDEINAARSAGLLDQLLGRRS
jgi:hypothetical protein